MRHYIRKPGSWGIFRPDPQGTPGITKDAHITINRLGLRGRLPKWTDKRRIIVMGGSTVEDNLLNDAKTWCGRLEKISGAWVGNAGRSATNSRHHLMQVERVLPRLPKPDLVLILCGLNDMLFDFGMHRAWCLPSTWDEEVAYYRETWKQRIARAFEPEAEMKVHEIGKSIAAYKARRSRVKDEDWIKGVPPLSGHLARYRARLEAIHDRLGSKLVFLTQPALWKIENSADDESRFYAGGVGNVAQWETDPNVGWYAPQTLAAMLCAYNNVMRDVCRERYILCVDLAALLEKRAANFVDDFHYSELGAMRVAEIVADQLGLAVTQSKQVPGASIYPVW